MTKGEAISQVRIGLKAVGADSRMPNKYIWNVILKHMRWIIKRESDKFALMHNDYLYQTLKCVEAADAPAIDDCCGVRSKCTVFRTKNKLPRLFEDGSGILIKSVYTIDGGKDLTKITLQEYMRKLENPNSKYDKSLYYYFNNGYLYFPKSKYRKIMIKGYFEDEVGYINECSGVEYDPCASRLQDEIRLPGQLLGEVFQFVIKEIAGSLQIREDTQIDKNQINIR